MKSKEKVYLNTFDKNLIYVIMSHSKDLSVTEYTTFALESIGKLLDLEWNQVFILLRETYYFIEAVTKLNLNNSPDPHELSDLMIDVTNQVQEWELNMELGKEDDVPNDVRDLLKLIKNLKRSGYINLRYTKPDLEDDDFDDYIPSTDYFESPYCDEGDDANQFED